MTKTLRSMLRQSRTITGNNERLHSYIKKLHSHTCTTVLFLGGSVTKGHKAGGYINSYPRFFIDWLNARYPCLEMNGRIGKHQAKFTSSTAHSSQEIVLNWPLVDGIQSFDLVFLEFNINDAFIPSNPHALEDKGPVGETTEYRSAWYFEVMLRRLLLLRKPDPVAIVTFTADYVGREWADKSVAKWAKKGMLTLFGQYFFFLASMLTLLSLKCVAVPIDTVIKARKTLFRKNPEPIKSWISSLYEVPVFSSAIWMLPLASKKGMKRQFMKGNPFSTHSWHWGEECCHPHREGHLVLSLVLAYCIVEEERYMISPYNDEQKLEREFDYTAHNKTRLRDPIYLSPEEDDLYVHNNIQSVGLDFTDPNIGASWNSSVVLNEGWSYYADNKDKDKYGVIATDDKGSSHIAWPITGGKNGIIEVSYIVSYENFGDTLAWLSDVDQNEIHYMCRKKHNFGTRQRQDVDRLSGHWNERASIPAVTILQQRIQEGEKKNLHICLLPHDDSRKWRENKFKLLGIRTY